MKKTICATALTLALTGAMAAAAQSSVLQGFEPIDDYRLTIDGELDEGAEIYVQRRLPGFLVLPSGSNSPLLLGIRNRMVQSVNLMKVSKGPAGTLNLASDAVTGAKGTLEPDGAELAFEVDGQAYRLVEKPLFLGLAPASGLEEYSDAYRSQAAAYVPDAGALDDIRETEGRVQVRIYLGSWCPFCKRYVPGMVRVANEIDEPNITIDFYGLPKDIRSDPVAGQARINSVPTGVVFVDGREVGRLSQDDWQSPEKALAKILADS